MTAAGLAEGVAAKLEATDSRIVITGAGGWIGMATLDLLRNALGPATFDLRVRAFGSQARALQLRDGTSVEQQPLSDLSNLPFEPTILLHTAFLTKDRAERMSEAEYVQANGVIRATVLEALDQVGVDKLFVASSGAAEFAEDEKASAAMRLYGSMKIDDEQIFTQWAREHAATLVVGRLFALSGPYINKPDTYALASFILDALARRRIRVRSPHTVIRSYVAVREMMSLVFALLLEGGALVRTFTTGGTPLELGVAAATVSGVVGGSGVERSPRSAQPMDRYVGNDADYQQLLKAFGIPHIPFRQQVAETAEYLLSVHTTGEAISA